MADGSYELIEINGDDKTEDTVVLAKAEAAKEMVAASGVEYKMYLSSMVMKARVLDTEDSAYQVKLYD